MRSRDGFTLIEILVALMVFLTGITGLLALMTTALALHRDGLNLARATGDLDGVRALVQAEVSAGLHFDDDTQRWIDIEATSTRGGTWYSVRFLVGVGAEPLMAEMRVSGTRSALARARPVVASMATEPSLAESVARYRTRRTRNRDGPGP